MTLRHMKIFQAICSNGCNTTRAAEALNMSQPAVSLAIRELESYYGIVLFDRIGRRLRITEAGREFLAHASQITSLFDDMERGMRNWDSFGLIRVGASITIGSQFLPSYVRSFTIRHPGVETRVTIAPSDQLERDLLSGVLDFALVEGVARSPSLVSTQYLEDHLTVIAPANGRFRQGETISLGTFRQQPFLLREKGSGTRDTFDRATEKAGFVVDPIWEAMSTTALVNAVIKGLGISVLPYRMVLAPIMRNLVVSVHVEGLSFTRLFSIIHHREKYLSSSARAFMELCETYEADYPMPLYNGLF